MKTFIVYDLDTGLPIAVGEALKAEWARVEAADQTQIRAENLIAEEITWERSANFCELRLHNANEVCSSVYTHFPCVCIASIRVLRPLFPIKPTAPFNGELIVIGHDFVPDSAKKPPRYSATLSL
jgi:hypothetical protein